MITDYSVKISFLQETMHNMVLVTTCIEQCYDAKAIPTRSRYAGTYAVAIAGRYGWEGLGGQGMGCEWLAG